MSDAPSPDASKTRWAALLRALTYGILMRPDPLDCVDFAVITIARGALGASPDEYLDAIGRGLASAEDLAELLHHDKPDAVLRDYLRAVAERLSARS